MEWITKVWDIMNTPAAIAIIGSIAAYLLSLLWNKKPTWQKYEGTIIAAVKAAEKAIPDTAENKAAKRLDKALAYVLKIYEAQNGIASNAVKQELKEGIQLVHNQLESEETLK